MKVIIIFPNVMSLATPHIAESTDVSINGIVKMVAENIRRLERGHEWPLLFDA